jgi:hypothetical protein
MLFLKQSSLYNIFGSYIKITLCCPHLRSPHNCLIVIFDCRGLFRYLGGLQWCHIPTFMVSLLLVRMLSGEKHDTISRSSLMKPVSLRKCSFKLRHVRFDWHLTYPYSHSYLWCWYHQQHDLLRQSSIPSSVTWCSCLQCPDPEDGPQHQPAATWLCALQSGV